MSRAIEPDYWAAAATILPVLATAFYLEAKSIEKQVQRAPRWFRTVQHAVWAVVMLSAALAELMCFRALRNEPILPGSPVLVEYAVIALVSTIIISPAILFVREAYDPGLERRVKRVWKNVDQARDETLQILSGLSRAVDRTAALQAELAHELWRRIHTFDPRHGALEYERLMANAIRADESRQALSLARRAERIRISKKRAELVAKVKERKLDPDGWKWGARFFGD